VIAEVLDIQENCKGIYLQNKFHLEPTDEILSKVSKTWKFSPVLKDDTKFKYLFLLTAGRDLKDFSKDVEIYNQTKKTLEAQQKAAITAKMNINECCLFDILPEHQLRKWFSIRSSALENLDKKIPVPEDYEILHKIHVLASNIALQKINYDGKPGRVIYDIFGSATGRLTTKKGSVPILTLKKEQRFALKPQNDAFVELDLNAAEIRMLMALSGKRQPDTDIHEWVSENVFSSQIPRDEVKVKVFSWLYNFSAPKSRLDEIFSRQIFRDFYLPEKQILSTPFGRKLSVDERKAQNYLLQSSTSDQVLENAYKIQKMIKHTKSKIAFTLHDSIVLDLDKKDVIMLKKIKDQFESTRWGKFMSTCKIGKDFGSLKEFKI
tara:strand:+ start:3096 stop:4229 length:1134 start_codon:yes stop_codon:yes gene_type:complete